MHWVGCLWFWITEHATVLAAVVSAVAAAVIAWFTVTLASATRGLKASADQQVAEAKALRKIAEAQEAISGAQTDVLIAQKQIARQQFLAEHRPKLRVRHVSIVTADHIGHPTLFFKHGGEVKGGLAVVNVGGTKATVVESRYRIYVSRSGLPASAPYDRSFHKLLLDGQILDVGESCAIPIKDEIVMEPPSAGTDVELRQFERGGWQIYVMGQIRYQDEGGCDRFMGFCRLRGSDGRFRIVDDQDYEFED